MKLDMKTCDEYTSVVLPCIQVGYRSLNELACA